jgi:preprotein translocase subunit SecA
MFGFLTKIFGSKNERYIKKLHPVIDEINAFESTLTSLSDTQLRKHFDECQSKAMNVENLDELLPEVFAIVREVSRRQLQMRHFDVQLIGGIVLHQGRIAEMKTGEGKTLVATLAVVLNALKAEGVHVVTVNDYLAKRDARWMGPIYHFLGLSVGVIQHEASFLYDPTYINEDISLENLRPISRQEAYRADITYGTNNEFGFDYLRDNMRYDIRDFVQREFNFAIVDEVDSILIDEARTPLIISGPSEESTSKYYDIDKIIPRISSNEYVIDEKAKTVTLTEEGVIRVERLLRAEGLLDGDNLFDPSNIETLHHVNQALRAHTLFKRDVDYLVKDNEVIIVDEFTGRLMPGRRWSDGLHQAIEAKEGVKIESENQTLATITFQNLFRMYKKLAGMTGTADTEAAEFGKIYNLDVVVIPTNKPMVRKDNPDVIYKTEKAKFEGIMDEVIDCYKRKQPVLAGTVTIENSEKLSAMLKKKGIAHSVLNAKFHEKEAEIIAQAGRSGAVTIATNMAGRGTDIVLGGNPEGLARSELKGIKEYTEDDYQKALQKAKEACENDKQKVIEAGGVHILGTERHEARRIDNQLRGRSGRQGDPGSSRFYLSLQDDLMRIFGSDRISNIMGKLGMEENIPIEHKLVSKAVENAQKKVEAHNFEIRKHLLEYDDVMNMQRTEIYNFRKDILQSESLKDRIMEMAEDVVEDLLDQYYSDDKGWDKLDFDGLINGFYSIFAFKPNFDDANNFDEIREMLQEEVKEFYEQKEIEFGENLLRYHERIVALQVLDSQWKDHLLAMDHLKEGIGLRGYGQRDPIVEYKKEAFDIFSALGDRVATEIVKRLFQIRITREEKTEQRFAFKQSNFQYSRSDGQGGGTRTVVKGKKVGRNEPCPCGSGKKHKKCCMLKAK